MDDMDRTIEMSSMLESKSDEIAKLRKWISMFSECDCETRKLPGRPHWFACRKALAEKVLYPSGRALDWRERADIVHRAVTPGLQHYTAGDAKFLSLFLAGEVGELCNLIKKEWMEEFGVAKPQGDKKEAIRLELADVRICLELLARCYEVDLDLACDEKLTICEKRWPEAGVAVRTAQEVNGVCTRCGHPVPPGFLACRGDGSHPAVAQ